MIVRKLSNKPFKSGLTINTVKETTINPKTGNPAYSFEEDNSIVDCFKCKETWIYDPSAPFWPWVEKFFTIDLLYDYENIGITDSTPRLCRMVGKELITIFK